jgi:acetyltransferase-like isoleucine patch superfamily enzyme
MSLLSNMKTNIKAGETPVFALLKRSYYAVRFFSVPVIPVLHKTLYSLHNGVKNIWSEFTRILYYTPMFKSLLKNPPKSMYLYSGMPQVLGNLSLTIGENLKISGVSTFIGRTNSPKTELIIGNNCEIAWQTTIAVGTKVVIGDDCLIAARAFFAGFAGHPLDLDRRAKGMPDDDNQIGDIILEQGVWLATGVTVSSGVTIGRGTIVAAGSVVTKSLPPFVLAGGVPAKVIRQLEPS